MAKAMVTIQNYDYEKKTTSPEKLECSIVRETDTHYRVRVMLKGEERIIRKPKDQVELPDKPKAEVKEDVPVEKKKKTPRKKKAEKD